MGFTGEGPYSTPINGLGYPLLARWIQYFPGARAIALYIVRLGCGFLGENGADGPQPYMFVSAVAQSRSMIALHHSTSQLQPAVKAKFNWSEKMIDKVRGYP